MSGVAGKVTIVVGAGAPGNMPAAPRCCAIVRPIPLDAPVMSAARPEYLRLMPMPRARNRCRDYGGSGRTLAYVDADRRSIAQTQTRLARQSEPAIQPTGR